jgi:hypothetical protein
MWVGDVLADRFTIERPVGGGGMGSVYRAIDGLTGRRVAVKVMDTDDERLAERFLREARVLAELDHPAIVRYVAHGYAADGEPYLAMEWLEGEDLHQRLRQKGVTIVETLTLARRVSVALAVAHARGVVHRDIKPSNLLLVGSDPALTKVVDFGIARLEVAGQPLTRSGLVLGTVGYMSPEQASGAPDVDARTDVFALGCVLFQCLTGTPPFVGEHAVAVLAKVLHEEAPRVRSLRAEVPAALDDLVARMLSKERSERPADILSVCRVIEALDAASLGATNGAHRAPAPVSDGEQRIISLVLVEPARTGPFAPATVVRTAQGEVPREDLAALGDLVERHGGELQVLANGALLSWFSARSDVVDQAGRVAACALALKGASPDACVAVATGRAEVSGRSTAGPVIDRAARLLLGEHEDEEGVSGVLVDDVTAGLLEGSFTIRACGDGRLLLTGSNVLGGEGRRLLGKISPFVGRDKELGLLEATLRECIDDRVARAVLVIGPAGIGKSRLRSEFVQRAQARGDVGVLIARADPVAAGSALLLGRQLIRRAADLVDGAPVVQQRERLRAHLAALFSGADLTRIADFLGEIVSIRTVEEPSPQLRAARNDPRLMADWLRRSFVEWLRAECDARPLVIVLEDLHWGDLPSVTYLGEVLYDHPELPLLILALGRPEVREAFPKMWPSRSRQEIELGGLTRRASERLVRTALGETVGPALVERVVRQADGNAFYLEELIRRVAERPDETLPETVLAMVESRLARLPAEARRLLRAASVFGGVFWEGGIALLIGAETRREDLRSHLQSLVEHELIEPNRDDELLMKEAYSFRHGLLREAAYAMLTEVDRVAAHRLAGEWLEAKGETDAAMMADHFEQGGSRDRAVEWLVRAASQAYESGNLEATLAQAERGLALGANGEQGGLLNTAAAWSLTWTGAWPRVFDFAVAGLRTIPIGTIDWFRAAASVVVSSSCLGNPGGAMEVLGALSTWAGTPEATGPYAFSIYVLTMGCYEFGQRDMAESFVERLQALARTRAARDPAFDGWCELTNAYHFMRSDDPGAALCCVRRAVACFEVLCDDASRMMAQHNDAMVRMELEQPEPAAKAARVMTENKERLGVVGSWGAMFSAWATVQAGQHAEAIELARPLLGGPDALLAENARCAIAEAELELGLSSAEATARQILAGPFIPDTHANALGVLARIELREQRWQTAAQVAAKGIAVQKDGVAPRAMSILKLVLAEALLGSGDLEGGRAALRDARDRILRIAGTLDESSERAAYLERVRTHVRTMELARAWLA